MTSIAPLLFRAARLAGCALALLAPAAWSQEAAVTMNATELRQSPSATAPALANLPAQTPVTRLPELKRPWVQVKTADGTTGWVHMFDLGAAAGGARADAGGSNSGGLRSVTNFLSRGGNTTTTTSASGIRGVTAEEIQNAQPNMAALGQLEALRQSEADARAFADRAPLRAVAVDPLPAPARPAAPAGGPGNAQVQ